MDTDFNKIKVQHSAINISDNSLNEWLNMDVHKNITVVKTPDKKIWLAFNPDLNE